MRTSIWLLICLISFCGANGQSLEKAFELGKELHIKGNYEGSAKLLERVAFFDTTAKYQHRCYVMLVKGAIGNKKLREVLNLYEQAINSASDQTIANELVLEKSALLIQHKKFLRALQELYAGSPQNEWQQMQASYLMGIAQYGMAEYGDSYDHFVTLLKKDEDSLVLKELFQKIERKLNPKKARIARSMSFVIPGSGQLMAGSVKSSLNSIILLSGLTYLYLYVAQEYGIASGLITVFPWFARYYMGGTENAFDVMSKRQARLKDRYFKEVLSMLKLN